MRTKCRDYRCTLLDLPDPSVHHELSSPPLLAETRRERAEGEPIDQAERQLACLAGDQPGGGARRPNRRRGSARRAGRDSQEAVQVQVGDDGGWSRWGEVVGGWVSGGGVYAGYTLLFYIFCVLYFTRK